MLTGNKMRAEEAKEVNSLEQPVRKEGRGRAESLSGEALLPMPPCPLAPSPSLCFTFRGLSLIP